eukprot:TRINITY_DN5852_c0_g1_i2.p1 TRINITY_DN5852_c0_g1~~TRINITY_DN5852_c0_g1_i2.p1  ORF type:complete len:752 (+),score=136.38 TRINITY_DN5852_c0_g1_i2:616-2871(+)
MFQRHFVTEVRKVEEMERRLRLITGEAEKELEPETDDSPFGDFSLGTSNRIDMGQLDHQLEEMERELTQHNVNLDVLRRNYNELVELRHVLTNDNYFFEQEAGATDEEESFLWDAESRGGLGPKLGFVTGIVSKSKTMNFERVLWRAMRGNLFMRHTPTDEALPDLATGELEEKEVFIIFYQGQRSKDKAEKICESFGATTYPCPELPKERRDLLGQVETRIADLNVVLQRSLDQRRRLLETAAPHMKAWKTKITQEMGIYHMMNLCNYDTGRKCLIAEGWCPKRDIDGVLSALRAADRRSDATVSSVVNLLKTREEPPTFFRTNKFTASFQGIVDAYGIARYREVNPGVYTIITFPFMFGIMFGDIGHGLLMFLFALTLILKEEQLLRGKLHEMLEMCFSGRYLLLLMAICSIFCGFIYNECFAVPLNLFGSRWVFYGDSTTAEWDGSSIAYPFGVDPVWKGARNELTFYNSLKMKMSVIFGVTQMMFGIILSFLNGLYFNKPYNIYFEFIPQVCFMMSTFGYMCFLIFLKWCTNFIEQGRVAPYLLNVMIDMFLKPTNLPEENKLFPGQLEIQWVLILIAFVSVPLMLFPKPFLLRRDHNKGYKALPDHHSDDDAGDHEEEFEFGEVLIHQVIHTIEFVLGAISNTASYLRLWALSLAHSELSTVFWDRVLVLTFEMGAHYSFVLPFIGFGLWAGATFGVLLVMESLSAFLHALRLHWVEFQNKFYAGDGYQFTPFSYAALLNPTEGST